MVYLLMTNDIYIKVGFTTDFTKRMSNYRTHNPIVQIIGGIESGDKFLEKELHTQLDADPDFTKMNNSEWYECLNPAKIKKIKEKRFGFFGIGEENNNLTLISPKEALHKSIIAAETIRIQENNEKLEWENKCKQKYFPIIEKNLSEYNKDIEEACLWGDCSIKLSMRTFHNDENISLSYKECHKIFDEYFSSKGYTCDKSWDKDKNSRYSEWHPISWK